MDRPNSETDRRKKELRRRLIAARRARSAAERADAAEANVSHLVGLLAGVGVVCGYLPLDSEPLSTRLLDRLVEVGTLVLVPVVSADAPLDWCRYPSPTASGAFGIAEPTGPRLGADVVRRVDAILLPALAVDLTGRRLGRGGGHYDRTLALLDSRTPDDAVPDDAVPGDAVPDDAVPGDSVPGDTVPGDAVPGDTVPGDRVPDSVSPELIAVLFDDEILDEVPAESHDMAVTGVVTPSRGIHRFRR